MNVFNTKWKKEWESQRDTLEQSMLDYPLNGYDMWSFTNTLVVISVCRQMIKMGKETVKIFESIGVLNNFS